MTEVEQRFVERAIRRQRLFLGLSIAGLAIAAVLGPYYAYRRWSDPAFPIAPRAVIVLLVLLNARQNLRQFRYSRALQELTRGAGPAR